MVEGPGCKLKGELLRRRVCGQKLNNIKTGLTMKVEKTQLMESFIGLTVLDIKTLGKELFIFFSGCELCIHIHFLMDGFICYNMKPKVANKNVFSLGLVLSTDTVEIFNSHADVRSASACQNRYTDMCKLDICATEFDFNRASELIISQQEKMICDVIMDQDILPGVGNIIKNEALFNSHINPNLFVKCLSSDAIACLLHRLRDFSAVFYECRKMKKNLASYMKIYGKKECSLCHGKVTICKPGDFKRVTYFCTSCQTDGTKSNNLKHSKSSLLQYLSPKFTSVNRFESWECKYCTLLNSPSYLTCLACLKLKSLSVTEETKVESWQCKFCTLLNSSPATKCVACESPKDNGKRNFCFNTDSDPENSKKLCLDRDKNWQYNVIENTPCQRETKTAEIEPVKPVCPGHGITCTRKQVTKSGENRGRFFFICSKPQAKQCAFFQWADAHHPVCSHGRVTIIRTVLKQNENNGREFYCCPLPKSQQCHFFQWVK